jgi:putative CocE/NonD family hydrolase
VGTFGGSYLAWDQYLAAKYRPPHLTAMFAQVGGANFFQEYGYPGGTPNLGWPRWMLSQAAASKGARADPRAAQALAEVQKQSVPWLSLHPTKRAELFAPEPDFQRFYKDFYAHPEFDSYWKQPGFYTEGYWKEMKDVPTYFLSGWYDYFLEGVLKNFTALSKLKKSEQRLMVGPWPHGLGAPECGDVSFGTEGRRNMQALMLEWFDHWLRGMPFQTVGSERVLLFRMGGGDGSRGQGGKKVHGGEWRTAPQWPPADAVARSYYMRGGGKLAPSAAPAGEKPSTYTYDPENPVPTIGGRYAACAQDQAPLAGRPDVLAFETEPLAAPVEVTGKVLAKLWISSDAVDTDFTAKLVDVFPDGYSLIITDGQLRTRYREGFEKARLMKPGTVYGITVDVGSTSNWFAKGHRIRVEISSSNFPKFDPNPNTGEPAGAWTRRARAANTVYHDAKRASHIELPVRR